jgi:hypothetical protein
MFPWAEEQKLGFKAQVNKAVCGTAKSRALSK